MGRARGRKKEARTEKECLSLSFLASSLVPPQERKGSGRDRVGKRKIGANGRTPRKPTHTTEKGRKYGWTPLSLFKRERRGSGNRRFANHPHHHHNHHGVTQEVHLKYARKN